ncbi:MAG: hypothetical protein UR70_C0017G0008 [Candidatus Nomurabacteria bacterium GW2011_GWB1_35_20]|uniref:Uncharacterized protein n=1 Tax=Candidatus Nomurabacteria bacterium GW2011_GWB1_35_20 TaxID=1618740 RepID=A0A0G0E985_9BACT|nr:MAG: hypothetical protein UR70_C0017G0008 [Candidatus Nomurabacteria bacterium GW2011_GWB1_35_20]
MIQIICLSKKLIISSCGVNDFMVKRPPRIIGITKKTKSQSILLIIFSIPLEISINKLYTLNGKRNMYSVISNGIYHFLF